MIEEMLYNGDMPELSDFKPQKKNANKHTLRGMKLLEDSIQEGGWIGAITAAKDGEVFAGSARLEKIVEVMPVEPLVVHTTGDRPVIVVRDDIPDANDPRAVRLALADNRIQQVDLDFDTDVLASIREQDASLLDSLWFEREQAALGVIEWDAVDYAKEWEGMPEFEQEDLTPWKTIKVHFSSEENMKGFAELIGQKITPKSRSIWYPKAKQQDDGSELYSDKS